LRADDRSILISHEDAHPDHGTLACGARRSPAPDAAGRRSEPVQAAARAQRRDFLENLSQVELVKQKDRYVPQFAKDVAALDQKQVKVQGFMMPLQTGDKQTHFVLTAMPQTCSFCLPGGPESMVEVKSKSAVKYTFEPVVLTGKLAILKDDPTGVFYRLTEAVPAK
jgi:hypothetical protein